MAYILPVFPSVCDIYTNTTNDFNLRTLRLSGIACQLRGPQQGPKFVPSYAQFSFMQAAVAFYVLFPAKTDVRDSSWISTSSLGDIVEAPAGTGMWYVIELVGDVARGFPNEHRFACLAKIFPLTGISNAPAWPAPMP